MINKLHRRKRNTTGFLKTFFTHFWNFVVEQSVKHPKFKVFEEHSNEFNHLANSLDLIGKVIFQRRAFQIFYIWSFQLFFLDIHFIVKSLGILHPYCHKDSIITKSGCCFQSKFPQVHGRSTRTRHGKNNP